MTSKEAVKYLIAPIATSTKPSAEYSKQKEAYELAIKALEQEPKTNILEQIIAEINTSNRGTCDYYIVDRIEEIINEYQKGGAE